MHPLDYAAGSSKLYLAIFSLLCARAEYLAAQPVASLFKAIHELGAEASGHQYAATIVTRPCAAMVRRLIYEQVLQRHLFTFHTLQFRNLDDLSAAILQAALLDDQLDGAGDLATND